MTARYTHPTTRRRNLKPGDVVRHTYWLDWGMGTVQSQTLAGGWLVDFPGRPLKSYVRESLALLERDGVTLYDRVEPA